MKPAHKCPTPYCRRDKRAKGKYCCRCDMRRWRLSYPDHAKLAILRDRAARKRVPFDLTVEWLQAFLDRNEYDPTLHHIDRIRTWEGYVMGNLQVLPMSENIAKGNRERHAVRRWATPSSRTPEPATR